MIHKKLILYSILMLPLIWLLWEVWMNFLVTCSNSEFIGWDPVSRFQTSLQMANHWREGKFYYPFYMLLDSPTWPALRSFPESLLILFWKPDTKITIYINFFIYIAISIYIYSLILKFSSSDVLSGGLAGIGVLWFLSIEPLQLYAFSGMLEIQGSIFFIFCLHSLLLFEKKPYLLPMASFLLLQTKYPYSIMFLFSLTVYLPFYKPNEMKNLFDFLKRNLKTFLKKSPILLFLPIPIGIFIGMKLGFIPSVGKSSSYVLYLIFLIFLIEFFRFTFRFRRESSVLFPDLFFIVKWVYLPSVLWMFIHPDRFSATTNTIKHEQGGGYLFFYLNTLFTDINLLIVFLPIILISISILFIKKTSIDFFIKPGIVFLFFPIVIILGQSILTPNQQERHIYHLYPAMILGVIFSFHQFIKLFFTEKIPTTIGLVFTIVYFFLWFLTENKNLNTCYAGNKSDIREYPQWVRSEIPKFFQEPTILVNDTDSNHVNKPDAEVEFSLHSYREDLPLLINPKTNPDPVIFKNLIRIGFKCDPGRLKQLTLKYFQVDSTVDSPKKLIRTSVNTDRGCLENVYIISE